ncbi:MAG: outer membrane protein assembly factor BamA [Gammaproteobacteria bacterium]
MKKYILLLVLLFSMPVSAVETFVVKDIRLEGLQRISVGTVFNYLSIKIGDVFDSQQSARALSSLYKTGFFKDISFEREGDVLVVFVAERPAIASIVLEGNDAIPTEELKKALASSGLREGRVFNRSVLETIERELQRQYYALGKYAVKVETSVTPLERNRVDVAIKIAEGEEARVYKLNIIGNRVFDNKTLAKKLELGGVSLFGGYDKYNKQILQGDIEKLRSFYMNQGYINFNIRSTQVALTPDKEDIYITINLHEGHQYVVRDIKVVTDPEIFSVEDVNTFITFSKGEVFSREKISETNKSISDELAVRGYAFANVNITPDVDEESRTVGLTVYLDPGRRVYVRRVNIVGNTKTKDDVIRREIRQMESSWFSTKSVSDSKLRLDRLGFFEEVNVETPAVPGTIDQVDVNYSVTERPTGSLSLGVGYSDQQGALINFALSQNNFVGTGNKVGINIDNSQVTKNYSFEYFNPYFTESGVSRGFSLYTREVDAEQAAISNYSTNSYGARLVFGIPLSEHANYRASLGFENTELITSATTATQITDFIAKYGSIYDVYTLDNTWTVDKRNRAIFATEGYLSQVSIDAAVPGSDLEYYRLGFRHSHYLPFKWDMSLAASLQLGYGDGYGDTEALPPFLNYFAGGARSVRGFDGSSLGPKDSFGNPLGGDRRIIGNLELVLPQFEGQDDKSMRFSLFLDGGYAYGVGEKLDLGEMRYSAGAAMIWLTPVGAMRFSLAAPLNDKPGDNLQSFQFTLGTPF